MAQRKNTRLEILQIAMRLFLKDGYTNTLIPQIAKEVGISKGNLAFHFHTKEHLLAELVKELCEFQWLVMEKELEEEKNPLLAYLFELVTMAGSCQDNPAVRELYISAYIHPMSLRVIRENDTKKAKKVFAEYCPAWNEEDFALAENIASGIEYAMFVTEHEEGITLDKKMAGTLDAIMKLYNVPQRVREEQIHKVLAMDYRRIGKRIWNEFREYVEAVNQKELEEAALHKNKKEPKSYGV